MVTRRPILETARQPGLLTKPELQAIELHYRGLSQRNIARELGISRSAVRDRLESALPKLARALQSTEAA